MIHLNLSVMFPKDIEVPIADTDFDLCDNALELTPPVHCPLPSTYSGSLANTYKGDLLKLFHVVSFALINQRL